MQYTIDVDTRQALSSISGLTSALKGLAGAFAIKEIVQFSDGITNLRNKLLTLTPDIETVNKQFTALASIAINSRTPLEATADLFFRIQRSAKALGISQREAAQITESVAKALTASGQSASEAAGPLLQLGQALQSGTFQGDELRSILEGLPQVAQALAQELNVPVGALKKLGSEGQISADVFVRAMRRAKDSIDEAFGRTQTTISQAITQLKTVASIGFDEFEQNTQTGRAFAAAIEYIAFTLYKFTQRIDEFKDSIINAFKIAAVILSLTLLGRAITFVYNTVAALIGIFVGIGRTLVTFLKYADEITAKASLLSKAFNFLAYAIGAALSVLTGFLGSRIVTFFKEAYDSVSNFIDKMFSASDSTSDAGKELAEFRKQLLENRDGLDGTASASENAAAQARELAKQYARLKQASEFELDNLNRTLSQERQRLDLENKFTQMRIDGVGDTQDQFAVDQARQRVAQDMYNTQQRINQEIQKLNLEYSQLAVQDSTRGKEIRNQISVLQFQREENKKIYTDHEEGMAKLIRDQLNLRSIEEARRQIQQDIISGINRQIEQQQGLDDILRGINQQINDIQQQRPEFATVGFSALQKQFIKIEDDARRSAQRASEQFAQGFGEVTPANEAEFARGLEAIIEGYRQLSETQKEFAKESYEISRTWQFGWSEALAKFAEDASDRANEAKTYFSTFVSGFESAITRFVQTGKLSFKDLINSLIADFAKLQARRMLFNFLGASGLGNLFGGGGATAGASVLGLPGFARGGYLPSGQMGIVGEQGPELITGPANITPMTEAASTTINYTINAVDAQSFRALVARDPQFIYSVSEAGRRSQPSRRLA